MRRNLLVVLTIVMLVSVAFVVPAAAKGKPVKVDVCHIPGGNLDEAHTISVAEDAVAAHLAHGDSEGACEDVEPANHAPVAMFTFTATQVVFGGSGYTVHADAGDSFDIDSDPITYSWTVTSGNPTTDTGMLFDATGVEKGSTLTLTVSDGELEASYSVTIGGF